jgi:hypothetical protein
MSNLDVVIWRNVYEAAKQIFEGLRMGDPRFEDAAVITIGTDLARQGRLDAEGEKALDRAYKNFVEKSADMIRDSSIRDSSSDEYKPPSDPDDIFRLPPEESGLESTPPQDPDDIFRPPREGDTDIGSTPPQGPDDIFRPKPDPNRDDKNKDDQKRDDKRAAEKDEEEEDDESDTEEDNDEEAVETAEAMPTADGEDDYTGVVRRFWGGPGERDPGDVADVPQGPRFSGGDDTGAVDPRDRYDGVDSGPRFMGGTEPNPPWEKVGPKFRPILLSGITGAGRS